MDAKEVRSDEARRQWSDLLDSVEHHHAHVSVLRYAKPAAVIVPVWWYEMARELMENGEQTRVMPPGSIQAGDRLRLRASGEIPSSHATITEGPA